MPAHIPTAFQAVTPYLSVEDAPAFIDFLTAAFGAALTHTTRRPDDTIQHAEVSLLGCMIELSEARADWPATRVALHLFVEDAAHVHAAAIAAGASPTYPVTDHPYGERSGGVRDRWGNDWFIATLLDATKRT
jgi:PhnB protein